jgi:hypothetical protein
MKCIVSLGVLKIKLSLISFKAIKLSNINAWSSTTTKGVPIRQAMSLDFE